jgi:iron complex outermembrane receptor protein
MDGHYLMLEELPGVSPFSGTIAYDHVFALPNGSTLVPRVDLRYTAGYYLTNLTYWNINNYEDGAPASLKPWAYQDSYLITNIGATWSSVNEKISVTGYVRNLFDEEYLTDVSPESTTNAVGATVGDPQTWGLVLSLKY